MGHRYLFICLLVVVVGTVTYAVRSASNQQPSVEYYPEVIYFARHINARLDDTTFRRRGWGMKRLQEEVRQMEVVFQTSNRHEDLLKEAVDVAVAAMMAAHEEGRKQRITE